MSPEAFRRSCAALVALIGALGLAGWLFDVPRLTWLVRGLPPMVPNTALALACAGASLWLRKEGEVRPWRRRTGTLLAAAAGLIGLVTLIEYLAGVQQGIDTLIIPAPPGSGQPRRPSPYTAAALLSAASALLSLELAPARRLRPSDALALACGGVGVLALAAYAYGLPVTQLAILQPGIGVALPTAAALILLGAGLLSARPRAGLACVLLSPRPGGYMARRLLAGSLLLVPALAALGVAGQRLGLYNAAGSVAFTMASALLVVLAATFTTANGLNAADEKRSVAEQRVAALVEQASDGIFVADLEGRYVSVNDAGGRLLGYERGELIGKRIQDVLFEEDVGRLAASRARLDRGEIDVADWLLRRKDGAPVSVEVSAKILPDGQWQAIVRDASPRQERERDRFRLALASAASAMLLVGKDGTITFANDQAERLFGYSLVELAGRRVDELLPCSDGRPRTSGELEARRRDGARIPVEVGITDLSLESRPFMVVSVVDVSRLKQAVLELEAFAYTVSHNLRAPLRAMEGYASLVERRLDGGAQAHTEARLMLRRISEAAQRLDRMIRDLLSLSALARMEVKLEVVDLDKLLAVEAGHYPELGKEGLIVRGPLGKVRAHPSLALQAVSNLLRNAAKFRPEGRAPRVEVWTEPIDAGFTRLSVEDNGPGIPAQALESIFEPFQRLRRETPGTGIGLAIVKRAAERMGGRVGVESRPGEGSRFWLDLPRA